MSAPGWKTVTDRDSSPIERERDKLIERLIERDGRPLSALGVVALWNGTRWDIEILARFDLLARLDARGRHAGTTEEGREFAKRMAAWVRGLPPEVCPELFRGEREEDGTWCYQRGTIERASTAKRRRS